MDWYLVSLSAGFLVLSVWSAWSDIRAYGRAEAGEKPPSDVPAGATENPGRAGDSRG